LTPFSRMIFCIPYDDDDTFMVINDAIKGINSKALQNIQGKYVYVSLCTYANHNYRFYFDRLNCFEMKDNRIDKMDKKINNLMDIFRDSHRKISSQPILS
jgi:hypothetical protein